VNVVWLKTVSLTVDVRVAVVTAVVLYDVLVDCRVVVANEVIVVRLWLPAIGVRASTVTDKSNRADNEPLRVNNMWQ
jgi:hypothetical protein